MKMGPMVERIEDTEELEDLLSTAPLPAPGEQDRPLVLLFTAPACASCYQAGQALELASEHLRADFYRLDVGAIAPPVLRRLGVTVAPTVVVWERRRGCEGGRLEGVYDAGSIWELLVRFIRPGGPAAPRS